MENQYVNAAFAILFLIAAVIAIHALFVLLFRPGRRKAAALRLVGATVGPIALFTIFLAVTIEVPEMTPERRAQIEAERERRAQEEADRIEAERLAEERAAAAEDAACLEDTQCWGDRHNLAAAFACEDRVERMARYSAEWTDGMWQLKFPRFRRSPLGDGIMVYIGDAIRFQTGFGAWVNMIYECTYDPATETVVDVTVREGRLP